MSVVYANPTGIFKGCYEGIRPTRNPDYVKLILSLETDTPVQSKESLIVSAKDSELFNKIKTLEQGKPYQYFLAVRIEASRTDLATGKNYGPRVQYKLLKVLG